MSRDATIVEIKHGRCTAGPDTCTCRLPVIEGSAGIFAQPLCTREANVRCTLRRPLLAEVLRTAGGLDVIACAQPLSGRGWPAYLHVALAMDILPIIAPDELWVAHRMAADYSRRRIPWALVGRGDSFALHKRNPPVRPPAYDVPEPTFRPVNGRRSNAYRPFRKGARS